MNKEKIPQDQRSTEWREWRKSRIGSSDIGALFGVGFKNIGELFDEKLGLRPPQELNEAMVRGTLMEEPAREAFEKETDLVVFPRVMVNPDYPYLCASLDGINLEGTIAVEIKCPGKKVHDKTLRTKEIPHYYVPQLQLQMLVTGLKEIFYYSYDPESSIILKLSRDEILISKIIERAKKFHELLEKAQQLKLYYEDLFDGLKDDLYRILDDNTIEPFPKL